MAYLFPISFSPPFCHREAQFQGTCARRLTGGELINPVTSRADFTSKSVSPLTQGKKHRLRKDSGGGMISSNGSHHFDIYSPTIQRFGPVLCHLGACFSVHVIISGFWMGPDMEDGWGFVEASVHQIY